ncbi:hypothetical protein E5288_WYG001983 [Bos mutus]|uniref:Uncharacterized protein n=1 Tax=Bos mutus TaxID=72004 RepID=A0A6B0RNS0_9CETA|nr:hypothetical protein [Bos mutus]
MLVLSVSRISSKPKCVFKVGASIALPLPPGYRKDGLDPIVHDSECRDRAINQVPLLPPRCPSPSVSQVGLHLFPQSFSFLQQKAETELLFKLPAVNIGKKVSRANVCPNGRKCLHFVCSVHKLDESNNLAPLMSTSALSSEGQAERAWKSSVAMGKRIQRTRNLKIQNPTQMSHLHRDVPLDVKEGDWVRELPGKWLSSARMHQLQSGWRFEGSVCCLSAVVLFIQSLRKKLKGLECKKIEISCLPLI